MDYIELTLLIYRNQCY